MTWFESFGADCLGRDSFTITAYAQDVNGKRLNSRYAYATFNYDGAIQVTLTAAYDLTAVDIDHAVYVQVTDGSSVYATNTICFMVTDSGYDFCRTICQE